MIKHIAIIAGGKGDRLRSVAGELPKVLVPVGGKPVLQHQLELAAAAGVEGATIFASHRSGPISEFTGDGSRFGIHVRVLTENEPMGNAGALLQSLDLLPEHFFVLYGDLLLAVDLSRLAQRHLERNADFTMMVHPNDHPHDSDLVETDQNDWVTAIHAYPHPPDRFFRNLVNAALYAVRREALRPWSGAVGKRDFTRTIMSGLVAKGGRVLAYRTSEYLKDMGTPARLERVERDWCAGKIRLHSADRAQPAIFLDRDGTLNVEKGHLRRTEDLELLPGVGGVLRAFRQAGYRLIVLTNQPVIARGEATEAEVAAIHKKLEWELGKAGAYLDGIYICPHHPDKGFDGERQDLKMQCECRKPGTKLLEQACEDLHIDLSKSWMIGDHARDIEMARRAGLQSILLCPDAGGKEQQAFAVPDYIAANLMEASDFVLQQKELISQ
jgi:D,D-heptose 1,7-bisphosphate phosphatase